MLSNSEARAAVIRDVDALLSDLEAHRKALSQKIAAIKADKIKGHLGMKISDFNIARRIARLDEEKRDPTVLAIRECFAALGIGGQLDWIEALNASVTLSPLPAPSNLEPAKPAEASPFDDPFSIPSPPPRQTKAVDEDHDDTKASFTAGGDFNDGAAAYTIGANRDSCPFGRGARRKMWVQGWDAEQAKNAPDASIQA